MSLTEYSILQSLTRIQGDSVPCLLHAWCSVALQGKRGVGVFRIVCVLGHLACLSHIWSSCRIEILKPKPGGLSKSSCNAMMWVHLWGWFQWVQRKFKWFINSWIMLCATSFQCAHMYDLLPSVLQCPSIPQLWCDQHVCDCRVLKPGTACVRIHAWGCLSLLPYEGESLEGHGHSCPLYLSCPCGVRKKRDWSYHWSKPIMEEHSGLHTS